MTPDASPRPVARATPLARALTLPLALVLALTVLTGWAALRPAGTTHDGGGAAPAVPTPSGCAAPRPQTVAEWQAAFTALHGDWEGADVAATVALPDGRTLWLFGDTLRHGPTGMTYQHNSMLMGERGCLTPVPGPGGAEPLPTREDGHWYWPTHGVVDQGRLYVFTQSVRATGPASLDFTGTGTEIAVFDLPPGKDPVFRGMRRTVSTDTPEQWPQWGAAVLQRDGYTYVYATQKVRRPLTFGRNVYVARVPSGGLADPASWRYWDGRTWSRSATEAVVVIDAARGVPTSFSVHGAAAGPLTLVAKKDDFLGDALVTLTASVPQGQWGRARYEQHSPSDLASGAVTYLALAHPDLPLASGGLLVSVSRNNLHRGVVETDPQQYRPKFYDLPAR